MPHTAKHKSRFQPYNSDRSGFKYKKVQLLKDKGYLVHPDEFDTPPPSKIPLGGMGDVSGSARANSDFTSANSILIPTVSQKQTVSVTADTSIRWNLEPYVYVSGSLNDIVMTADPQIITGASNQTLAFFCVGSTITILSANNVALRSERYRMTSGAILNMIYLFENSAWVETSRGHVSENYGVF